MCRFDVLHVTAIICVTFVALRHRSTAVAGSTEPEAPAAITAPAESAVTVAADSAALPALVAADFDGLGTCSLMPEKTAGPFPLDQQLDRRDITEGYPGQPMRLGLRVLDATCSPVPGATVEIWHADATGDYSAFTDNGGGKDEGAGTTFLRGTQTADADGIVEFLTVYPGWYRGRAVHIHLRVHLDDEIVLTSQMFFDDDYTAGVYAAAPYAEFGLPDTPNGADNIAGNSAAEGTMLHTSAADTANGPGTLALLNLGVDASVAAFRWSRSHRRHRRPGRDRCPRCLRRTRRPRHPRRPAARLPALALVGRETRTSDSHSAPEQFRRARIRNSRFSQRARAGLVAGRVVCSPMRVLVLGAGFGGLELTTRLSEQFGDDVDVVLIDRSDGFVFGFSKLDVMFGKTPAAAVHHPYRDLVKPGVRFVQSTVRSIDPVGKRVETDAGTFEADILVVALGADLASRTPRRGWSRVATSSTPSAGRSRCATCCRASMVVG